MKNKSRDLSRILLFVYGVMVLCLMVGLSIILILEIRWECQITN